jgi:hypothetical protein
MSECYRRQAIGAGEEDPTAANLQPREVQGEPPRVPDTAAGGVSRRRQPPEGPPESPPKLTPSDPLHAIYGMRTRSLLLPSVGAGHRQITTGCSIPLLSLAVPCFMPQICPRPLWVMSHSSTVLLGAHPSGTSPSTGPLAAYPRLFLAVSASLGSKP